MSYLSVAEIRRIGGLGRRRVFEVKPYLANSQTRPKYTP